jgi:hypothetical protein
MKAYEYAKIFDSINELKKTKRKASDKLDELIDVLIANAMKENTELKKKVVHLQEVAEAACVRMDRARTILTHGNPRPDCNWGMLDTTDIRNKLDTGV